MQRNNPFGPKFSDPNYGKPIEGSLTAMRGKKANFHVNREMLQLCEIIDQQGMPNQYNPELKVILFGDLFDIYNYISNKVVGILLRARKHGLVYFEGEMLFQRRDDDVPIFMLKPLSEIRQLQHNLDVAEAFDQEASGPALPTSVLMDRQANQRRF
ncbi:actin-binding Rho-activating protein-like [Condylostylus longicornis]|uniref:actin-binding Rho-activating protein-like n=1 Tax=Condylostylus longicornis TaxID=2530218 RepID=UPI00244E31D3|nr:actin-binding Rho-activating protein-like [Condylostylus longicornis]